MAPTGKSPSEAFQGARNMKPGFKAWRVNADKQLVAQSKGNSGVFYDGDCYIILQVVKEEFGQSKTIFFWVGEDCNLREELIADDIATELDALVEAKLLLRQVQGHESKDFLQLFPAGVKYLQGSNDVSRKHFQDGKYIKRLFQVKGKKVARVTQIELSRSSLNHGGSFVLDDEWTIYCWNGTKSSKLERIKAIEVARNIRDQLCFGKAEIVITDSGVDQQNEQRFLKAIGDEGKVKLADEDTNSDGQTSHGRKAENVHLYRVCESDGEIEVRMITERPLRKKLLDPNDCFLLDTGAHGIFAWIGSKCSKEERRQATRTALKFIYRKQYPMWTPVTRVLDGGEPKAFKQYFATWTERRAVLKDGRVEIIDDDGKKNCQKRFRSTLKSDTAGKVKVWRIEGFNKVPWPEKDHGTFYEGDCYIILSTSVKENTHQHIIYTWMGCTSSTAEKERCVQFAQQVDEALKGQTTQVQVVHGKEPEQFLRLFKGRMVTLLGGVDTNPGISQSNPWKLEVVDERDVFEENDNQSDGGNRFFHIRGNSKLNTRAAQMVPSADALDSNDAFLLITPDMMYIWEGKDASDMEKDFAEDLACYIKPDGDLTIIQEGFENNEFWNGLGGKADYKKDKEATAAQERTRLYHCTNESGKFTVDEVNPYEQEDLQEDDVMILDTFEEIYVWLGQRANEEEKRASWKTATEFIASDPHGRTEESTPIIQIKQGLEPTSFTDEFDTWDPDREVSETTYEDLKEQVKQENQKIKDKKPSKTNTQSQRGVAGKNDQRNIKRAYWEQA